MKKKKTLSCVIAMVLMAVFLVGCTTSNEPRNTSSPDSQSTNYQTVNEEKPTLRILGYNASFDPNTDLMASEIAKSTGYSAEYFMLPAENADEKLNIELSSGSNYDIVMLLSSQYYKLVGQGALLPLDDLLNEHGEYIKAAVQDSTWKACTYEEQIYALPFRKEYTKDVTDFIFARKDIIEEAGKKIPTTLDEFYDVLKAIKEKRSDLIPFTGPNSTEAMAGSSGVLSPTINSAFGIYNVWQEVDGKLVNMLKHPRMKDVLTFMNKLYAEGLCDADWPINTGTIINEKFSSGNAAMAMSNRNTATVLLPVIRENLPDSELAYILPLIGANGEQGAKCEDSIVVFSCIPKNSKNAAHAMKFMNLKQKPDNFLYLTLGVEGTHFSRDSEEYIPIMPIFSDERTNSYWYLTSIDEYNYPTMWMSRVRKNADMWEIFEKVSLASDDIAVSNPLGYMPPNAEISKYQQSLDKMANDYYLKVITDAEPISSYDEFVKQWDAAGGEQLTNEINSWYLNYNK
jgi:putative aldouronate transport system substrate-binding protein